MPQRLPKKGVPPAGSGSTQLPVFWGRGAVGARDPALRPARQPPRQSAPRRHIMQRERAAPAALPRACCGKEHGVGRLARNKHSPRQGKPSAGISRAASPLPSQAPAHRDGPPGGPLPARRQPEPAGLALCNSRPQPRSDERRSPGGDPNFVPRTVPRVRAPSYLQRTARRRASPAPRRAAGAARRSGGGVRRCGAVPHCTGSSGTGGRERAAAAAARRDVC